MQKSDFKNELHAHLTLLDTIVIGRLWRRST